MRIVERKDTNLSFALKYIRKDEGMEPFITVCSLWPQAHGIKRLSVFELLIDLSQLFDLRVYETLYANAECSNM